MLLADGSALPSWMRFTSTGTNSQTITLMPTDKSQIGTYTIKVVFDPTNGSDVSYSALTVTVACAVTSVTAAAAPTSNLQYYVWADTNYVHDFASATYTQVPDCGYAKTDVWAWTLVNDSAADTSALSTSAGALSVDANTIS